MAASTGVWANACSNCETEELAVEAAQADVIYTEEQMNIASDNYANCTGSCTAEYLALLTATANFLAAESALDAAQEELDDCLNGGGPPPPPPIYPGEESVLVAETVEHD